MAAVVRAAPVPTMRSELRSACSSSGLPSIRAHWVGTPWPTVTRSSAMIRMASSALQGVGVITVVTACATSSQVRVM